MSHVQNWPRLLMSLVIGQSAGLIGSFFTMPQIYSWYSTLVKPSFNPPNWVFGPVWTLLYVLMGISLYLVWQSTANKKKKDKAVAIFSAQLILNIFWSIIFFALHSPGFAFLEIIILWISIAWTASLFYKINKTAAYLLLPYIAWVSFASVLNFAIWYLN